MRKLLTSAATCLLVVALGSPAWASDPRPSGLGEVVQQPTATGYEAKDHPRDRHYRDGYHRDGRWYYRDGRWYYDDRYRHPHDRHPYYGGSPTRDCHDGQWRYHPQAGWMCV